MKIKSKPPFSVHVLQRWIADAERETGVAVARQQRWVSFMVLAAMLDAVRDRDGEPLFLLKGGVAMELRLNFTARRTQAEAVRDTAALRFDIKLDYRGRPWATVKFEVPEPYRALAEEVRFTMTDVTDAAQAVQATIDAITQA